MTLAETLELDPDTTELWMDSPLVKHATRAAGDQASALDVLHSLHGVLTELEERFPGVPFADIYCGEHKPAKAAQGRPEVDLSERLAPGRFGPDDWRLGNLTMNELMTLGYSKGRAKALKQVVRPFTATDEMILEVAGKMDVHSVSAICRVLGVASTSVHRAGEKWHYQRWVASNAG